MIEFDYMSYSEQLVALLDGELHASEATPLFLELSHNAELQDEMHELLTLKQFFGVPHAAPPDHLKRNILLTTGLGTASALISSGAASSPLSRFWMGLVGSKGVLMLVSAIIGGLAAILMSNPDWFSGSNYKVPLNPALMSFAIPSSAETVPENREVVITEYKARTPVVSSFPYNDDITIKDPVELSNFTPSTNNELTQNEAQVNVKPIPVVLLSEAGGRSYSGSIHILPLNELSKLNLPQIYDDDADYDPSRLSLQLRGFTARSIPEFNLAPLDAPVLNNIGIGLFYKFDKHFSVGLEVGQESVLQKYDGLDREGIPTQWQQNYIAFWTGIAGQYNFNPMTNLPEIQPFTRIFIGGTKVGPMGRAILGLKYNYRNTLDIFSGVETSVLFYRFQGNTFTTQKIGLTFGGSVHF